MSAYLVSGAIFDVTYFGGMVTSGVVTTRRGQRTIRARVEARGGRPIGDAEAWSRLVWCGIKSLFWPVNLLAWLLLGRPGPGTYAKVARPGTPAPTPRSAEDDPPQPRTPAPAPVPAGVRTPAEPPRHSPPSVPSSSPGLPPAFPTGPEAGPPRAPLAPGGPKTRPVGTASIPPARPVPALSVPAAEGGAPQLPNDYAARLLGRAGFPATPHNLFAVQERLGILFTIKARQFVEGMGTERQWRAFVDRAGYPTADMQGWPQLVLNAIAHGDADSVPHIQDFYERYSSILLEGLGSGNGFFGGPTGRPLPTATDWNMKGLAQPSARPLPAPRS